LEAPEVTEVIEVVEIIVKEAGICSTITHVLLKEV
jgi:hypothetical protein